MALNITGNSLWWEARLDNSKLQADSMRTQGIFRNLATGIGKAGLFAGVTVAGVRAIKEIINVNKEFEKSISVLSSLTGAVGDDLDFYREKAIEFGESTTQSATQVADAFKLVGSQKPELLATKEALADVTKEAITLAEAAQVDVTDAARALTLSLNQTSAGAEKSSEYINILAAASQKGAGDIPYLNSAIEKTGKVAHDSNLTFAEMVSVIEQLAPAISEPSSAGLHMNQVLLRLQAAGYGFSTGMFDLQEALHDVQSELDGIQDPAKRAAKEVEIFGVRSITAGKVMLETKDKFKDFANTISGTNTAYEQAKTNTDNLEGSIVKFKSAVEGLTLRFGGATGLNANLKWFVDLGTEIVQGLSELIEITSEYTDAIGDLFKEISSLGEAFGLVNEDGKKLGGLFEVLKFSLTNIQKPLEITVKSITLLVKGIKSVVEWVKEASEMDSLLGDALRAIGEAISWVVDGFEEANQLVNDFFNSFSDGYAKTATEITNRSKALAIETSNTTKKLTAEELEELSRKQAERIQMQLEEFERLQENELSKYLLIEDNEEKITAFKQQQFIDRLEAELAYNNQLVGIERETIKNKIKLLEEERDELIDNSILEIANLKNEKEALDPLIEAQKKYYEILKKLAELKEQVGSFGYTKEDVENIRRAGETFEHALSRLEGRTKVTQTAFETLGDSIVSAYQDGELSAEEFGNTLRNVVLKVISTLIAQAVASVVADTFEKNGIKGLVLAPVFGAATYALFNSLIPKFSEGKPADFTGGGIINTGSPHSDTELGLFKRDEIVLNPKQQANLIWNAAKGNIGNNNIERLLIEQNSLLRNAKQAIQVGNKLIIIKNGNPTGEKHLLSKI